MIVKVPERLCKDCGVRKPQEDFDILRNGSRSTRCHECAHVTRHQQRAVHTNELVVAGTRSLPERVYNALFTAQNGRCGACGHEEKTPGPDGRPKRLGFYAHSNGARLLVCTLCDIAMKAMRDDVSIAAKVLAVLSGAVMTVAELRVHDDATVLEVPPPCDEP